MALAPPPRCWHSCGLVTGNVVIRWAAVQFVLRVRRHGVGTHEAHWWIVRFDRCPHDFNSCPRPLVRILVRGGVRGFGHGSVAGAVGVVIRWAAGLWRIC